jgi:hypothetical protein
VGCLRLIAGDPIGLANFTAVIELLVDNEHCKHSFLSEALGGVRCLSRARPREGCCSACSAAQFQGHGFVDVDATTQVYALCFVVETFHLVEGKAPTITRLLEPGSLLCKTDWTAGEAMWKKNRNARAFLLFSLIGLRRLRILRFAPTDADDPATAIRTKFPSAPVAVNQTEFDRYLRTGQRITVRFPTSLTLH